MKAGVKRSLVFMMLTVIPFLYANPTSALQEVRQPIFGIIPKAASSESYDLRLDQRVAFGTASWYSRGDRRIQLKTANGDRFDDTKMTCASWNHPFQTKLRVTNLSNGRSVVCVVNDRGPAKRLDRIVDLTKSAFRKIENPKAGLVRVAVEKIAE